MFCFVPESSAILLKIPLQIHKAGYKTSTSGLHVQVLNVCVQLIVVNAHVDQLLWMKRTFCKIALKLVLQKRRCIKKKDKWISAIRRLYQLLLDDL